MTGKQINYTDEPIKPKLFAYPCVGLDDRNPKMTTGCILISSMIIHQPEQFTTINGLLYRELAYLFRFSSMKHGHSLD